jgi:hybrid polyketide synthase/nonribosomal peptide synthetase ACE1
MQLEWPVTVAHRIDQVIAQHPDFIALKDGNGHAMTYAAMDERIESIASVLREQLSKHGNDQVVGVFQMPSNDYICSMLAINRIGAIYLPLDLRNGAPRLKSSVKAARPVAILTDSETVERIDEIRIVKQMVIINVSELHATPKMKRQDTAARPDGTAYIIFTSGSTGEPKGITVKHAGLMANIEGFHREWDVANLANVMLQQSAFSFDASLLQIYAPLTTGGCLLVVPADARGDPQEVTRLMVEHGVTMTQATPSEYDMWFRFAPDNLRRCQAWKAAFFGGERATSGLLEEFRNLSRLLPDLRLLTSYGPTEVSISAIKGEVDLHDPHVTVPIPGRLLPNYAAYIVDGEMRPVPVGVPGEIIIGGLGVGQNEYLDQPELTAKAFIADRFATHQKKETGWGRMYRTGDYGRLNARGYLSIEGRIAGDTQVKLRGFRIELTEIERVILQEGAGTITHAVVTLRGEGEEAAFLAAHIALEEKSEEARGRIIDKLRARLPLCIPQYMCPGVIVALDEIPLTTHDKVDRRAVQMLSLPSIEAKSAIEQQQSLTQTERRLARLWTGLLHPHTSSAAPLTQQSDFFLDGGNSLLLVKLQASIKCEFGDAPRLSKLMSAPGLASMAALLDSIAATVDWDKEMALGSLMDEIPVQPRSLTKSDGLRIVLTGATGHLGRRILAHLAADKRVSHIVCLVRPAKERDLTNLFPGIQNKVHVVSADLPFIPTTHPELSAVDTVVHCAANRSFWDSYNVVKSVNVDTVKLLAEFCLRTGASLHVLSSGAVTAYETDGDAASSDSSNLILPRPNPNDGYLSSKWVAERYLARVARLTGLRATVHRPTAATPPHSEDPGEKVTEMEADFVRSMVFVASKIGVQPDFAPLGGLLDIMDLEDMTEAVAAVIMSEAEQQNENELRIVNYPATARVRTDALAACTDNLLRHVENEAVRLLPAVSGLEFVGLAKRAGLFGFTVTSHELSLADGKGQMVVTRR